MLLLFFLLSYLLTYTYLLTLTYLHLLTYTYLYLLYIHFTVDINECTQNLDDCHQFATCTNTVGSFECRCNVGYEGDGVNCRGIFILYILCRSGVFALGALIYTSGFSGFYLFYFGFCSVSFHCLA